MISYNEFEFCKFKDYEIDHDFNRKLLETLEEFVNIIKQTKLNYYLTGSLCLSFLTNKIYRTWKDIDIIVKKDSIFDFIKILPKDEWYYKNLNKNSTRIFYSKYDTYIELMTPQNIDFYFNKRHLKIQQFKGIHIGNAKPMFFWKKNKRRNFSERDIDDEIFYKQYLDLEL